MDIGDIMQVMDAQLGDPVAGFALLRKMVSAATGEYEPTDLERAYFKSCADSLAAMKRPISDPKLLQRNFARAFNLTRKPGKQYKDDNHRMVIAADIKRRMKLGNMSQDSAIASLLADPAGPWRDYGGISPSNLAKVAKKSHVAEIVGKKPRRKTVRK